MYPATSATKFHYVLVSKVNVAVKVSCRSLILLTCVFSATLFCRECCAFFCESHTVQHGVLFFDIEFKFNNIDSLIFMIRINFSSAKFRFSTGHQVILAEKAFEQGFSINDINYSLFFRSSDSNWYSFSILFYFRVHFWITVEVASITSIVATVVGFLRELLALFLKF